MTPPNNSRLVPFILFGVTLLLIMIVLGNFVYDNFVKSNNLATKTDDEVSDQESLGCNVIGVSLLGTVLTYSPSSGSGPDGDSDFTSSDSIVDSIKQATKDEKIKAILIEIDSYGGYPVAGEEIAFALKNASKPTVAIIRQGGVSAAYWAATGAEWILASKNSDVGSIGVTQSYLDNVNKNQKEGLSFVQLSVGKYKDTGNPDKTLTTEEKNLFMRDLNIIHQNFIEAVATNRGLSIEKITEIADGSTVLGARAKELGLIDEIGRLPEAEKYLSQKIGEEIILCWE